jgi:hypothetical protein
LSYARMLPRLPDHPPSPGATRHPVSRRGGRRLDSVRRGVAQLGSALALGARGRGFKSRHPDQVRAGPDDLPGLSDALYVAVV